MHCLGAHGFPVLFCSVHIGSPSDLLRSFGCSHTRTLLFIDHQYLPPFAMYQVLPGSDYYGGSVALSLSACRLSRILVRLTSLARFAVPFCPVPDSLSVVRCGERPGR